MPTRFSDGPSSTLQDQLDELEKRRQQVLGFCLVARSVLDCHACGHTGTCATHINALVDAIKHAGMKAEKEGTSK